ncbi:DUF4124 domain-containing protein [Massilia pseudoviolaceinigra]|uniref:DUF4124 domain-containing protein n=1 Tax=Massilia pseudoviolaceinigra TaxID=3057165 RepID=UPI002796B3D8|nr:DUF4124 domain-containing protein [Massilia sp. CCM 9206]MDQ1921254.1 DUF4124 domain-containing protein [Massilia sp. CCM 9206]
MLHPMHILALCALSGAAHAGPIYKCTTGGKVSYGDQPCANGSATQLGAAPAPAADPNAAKELQRQKDMLARLQKERATHDARQAQAARSDARAWQAAAVRQAKCAGMQQQQSKEQQRLAAEAAKAGGMGKAQRDQRALHMARAVDAACRR